METFTKFSITILLGICISGCASGQEAAPAAETSPAETVPAETIPAETAAPQPTEEQLIETVYENGKAQTICIFTTEKNNGTGFIYKDQFVVTNDHIFYDTDEFSMIDAGGTEYTGTLIFRDQQNDIAVIQVEGLSGSSSVLGDSDALSAGDTLVCIGNPGEGEPFDFVTGKCLDLDEELEQKIDKNHRFIHSDADLISGYSGGPVFNMNGEVIGLSNAAYVNDLSEYEFDHLSLIIPINRVREMIESACSESN